MKIFIIFFFLCNLIINSQTIVKGKLLGYDNKPLKYSSIYLIKNYKEIIEIGKIDKDGSYEIRIPDNNSYNLIYTGLNHFSEGIKFINIENNEEINVKLKALKFRDDLDSLKSIKLVEYIESSKKKEYKLLKKENNFYEIEIESNEPFFKYQFIDLVENEDYYPVNDIFADSNEISDKGWLSIKKPENNKVKIIFDPKNQIYSNNIEEVEFITKESKLYSFYKLQTIVNSENKKIIYDINEHNKKSPGKPFNFDFTSFRNKLSDFYDIEKDEEIKKLVKMEYLLLVEENKTYRKELTDGLLDEIPLNSTLWQWNISSLIKTILFLPENKIKDIEKEFMDLYKDKEIQAQFIAEKYLLYDKLKNEEEKSLIYDLIEKKYSDTNYGKIFFMRFGKRIQKNDQKQLPNFELTSLGNKDKIISKSSMLGKVYLIDFWATWCIPCVEELGNLHKVYEKYKSKGLEILSISFDSKEEEVHRFRKTKWEMPWLNAFVENGFLSKIAKDFEVKAIPKLILVNKNGEIIMSGDELRGEKLEKSLEKFFK